MGYRQPVASFTGPCLTPWNPSVEWRLVLGLGRGRRRGAGPVRHRLGDLGLHPLARRQSAASPGLRPSYGRVSRHGAMALCWTLDKLGPLALTADDCGLVLEAIAGADAADSTHEPAALPIRRRRPARRRFRFGVLAGALDGVSDDMRTASTARWTCCGTSAPSRTRRCPISPGRRPRASSSRRRRRAPSRTSSRAAASPASPHPRTTSCRTRATRCWPRTT